MPLPCRGRGRAGAPAANPLPAPRRGRGSSADALPTRRRRRRSPADPTPTRCRARAFDDSLLPGLPSAVHSDVQVASGGEQVSEPASPQTQHKLDVLPLKDPRYTMTMEGSSATAASLPSRHGTIEASPPSGRSLSSSPIWIHRDFEWGISFYTIKDLGGYFHTFPDVGGPFHSNDQVNKAIHLYLTAHEAPRM
jgi:hypothetical protein